MESQPMSDLLGLVVTYGWPAVILIWLARFFQVEIWPMIKNYVNSRLETLDRRLLLSEAQMMAFSRAVSWLETSGPNIYLTVSVPHEGKSSAEAKTE